ncbi:NAD-dependent epimerase/dehydratase family protein [Streptomyces luomodiensis]|uniref:NAD-dependent epimerase/dehydratase family protein n=1 Tax=Streptomyces luomodiensis TaxID=3026192 RepID=A0ABY9V7S2_9ACTN|nr:NAD-dependent epimerase/dehydratase family protein [Streptomyces sp. SCA4-21]WNF00051.1 NAD-dependent epimerase/dehydratase family protein [Streptomyces sp. SCA4-21]
MTGEVLVTGAAGFIGGHLAAACRRAGFTVTALDPAPSGEESTAADGVVPATAGDAGLLADVRAGRYRAVLHQGGISSTLETDRDLLRAVNVDEPLALAEACAAAGTPFAYASSHSVYGTIRGRFAVVEEDVADPDRCTGPLNDYAWSKLTLDQEMTARFGDDAPWSGYRYTNVFGTGEERKGSMASIISQLLRQAATGVPLRLFADTLEACRDYVPVETVVDTLLDVIRQPPPPGVYNLGSGVPVSFATLLGWCGELRGEDGLAVHLVPNPVSGRYQYWTCADQSRTGAVLPRARGLAVEEVRSAAHRLYRTFAGATAQPVP